MANLLRRETAGNPFFVTEIVRHLAETGTIQLGDDGRWIIDADLEEISLPQSVREVIGARVARLGETATRVLTLAAVIGRDFELGLLARVSDVNEDDLLDILDAARETALLRDIPGSPDRFTFSHGLIEHTLYEDLSHPRRQRAHLRVAEALEDLDPTSGSRIGELAYHWAQATAPTDAAKAIGYAQRAGDDSLARLAPDEAIRWYGQALDLLDQQPTRDPPRRCDLLIGLGTARSQAGDPGRRETLREAVRVSQQLGSPERLVAAVLASETFVEVGGGSFLPPEDRRESIEIIESALVAVTDAASTSRARLLGYLATVTEQFTERLGRAEEAVAIARRVGDPVTLADVLIHACTAIVAPETLDRRLEWGHEACRIGDELEDLVVQSGARATLFFALSERGEFEARAALLIEYERIAEQLPMPQVQQVPMTQRGWDLLLAGRLDEVARLVEQGRAEGERWGYRDGAVVWGVLEFSAQRCAGDVTESAAFVQAIGDTLKERLGNVHHGLVAASALIACELGRQEDARPFLEERAAAGFAAIPHDQSWLSQLNMWSAVAAALDNQDAASILYEQLTPWPDRVVVMGNGWGGVSHYLGLLAATLGNRDAAERHFDGALALHDRLAVPYWSAQTRIALARMLETSPADTDRARAIALSRESLQLATDHGFAALGRQASDLVADLT